MVNERTYYLDLPTLLALLRNKKGMLTTNVKVGGRRTKGEIGTGTIVFANGKVIASTIEWSAGSIEGDEAYNYLSTVQEWNVHFEVLPPVQSSQLPQPPINQTTHSTRNLLHYMQSTKDVPVTGQGPTPGASSGPTTDPLTGPDPQRIQLILSTIPQPHRSLTAAELDTFTSQQRRALLVIHSLVDGYRSVEVLQVQTNYPLETLMWMLDTLRSMGKVMY